LKSRLKMLQLNRVIDSQTRIWNVTWRRICRLDLFVLPQDAEDYRWFLAAILARRFNVVDNRVDIFEAVEHCIINGSVEAQGSLTFPLESSQFNILVNIYQSRFWQVSPSTLYWAETGEINLQWLRAGWHKVGSDGGMIWRFWEGWMMNDRSIVAFARSPSTYNAFIGDHYGSLAWHCPHLFMSNLTIYKPVTLDGGP